MGGSESPSGLPGAARSPGAPGTFGWARQTLLTALVAALVALLPWFWGGWERWEAKTWDMRAAHLAQPGAASDSIALILLDQQSLDWGRESSGLSWPWPREVYAAVVDFCRRAKAASLTLDVLFLEPSAYGVEDDALLARALEQFGPTALAAFLGQGGSGGLPTWPDYIPDPAWELRAVNPREAADKAAEAAARISAPIAELVVEGAVLGNVRLHPDSDGVYRRVQPVVYFDQKPVPVLALAGYLTRQPAVGAELSANALNLPDRRIPLDPAGAAILRYRGPSGTHAAYSAAAVLQSELRLRETDHVSPQSGLGASSDLPLDPALLRGKHVFFGFSAPGLFDLRPTPVAGVYPGVEIQATFLDNLLSEDFMRAMPVWAVVGMTLAMSLFTGLGVAVWRSPVAGGAWGLTMILLPAVLAGAAYVQGWWMPLVVQQVAAASAAILGLLANYATLGRQKRFIKNAFQQYLSPAVIEQLIAHPERLRLGGERKSLSIFFSDLQGFTSISEQLDPEALTALLNDYLSAMTEIIHAHGGTVDKYEGDAVIAFWNAPLDVPDHARRAVNAALRCQARLAELRPEFRRRTGHDLYMRIGLNTGPAVVGNMGSHSRFDYSMLGDAVNLAARLEGVNKQFGSYTLVSEFTRDAVLAGPGRPIAMRELGRVAVVGRRQPVRVFEPLGAEFAQANARNLQEFAQGLRAYYQGDFTRAIASFQLLAAADPPAARYLEACTALRAAPPRNWDGVWRMVEK
jgi:adenylate cyclase